MPNLLELALEMRPMQKERALLVVNDQLIRQKYFSEANDVIAQMEALENKIQRFHARDQKLFDQWQKLTFREDQAHIDQTQSELKQLAQFHNWIIAASHMFEIELPQAFLLIKEEQLRYENGSEKERQKIETDREKRQEFIERDSRARYDEDPIFETSQEESESEDQPLNQIFERLEELLLPQDREVLSDQTDRMERLNALSDEEIKYAMKDQEASFLLFHTALSWGERKSDFLFFLRLWKLFSKDQKKFFSQVYESITGESLESLARQESKKSKSTGFTDDIDEDEEDLDFQFKDDFIGSSNRQSRRAKKLPPLDEERFKQIYRKLIRRLHPDAHASGPSASWMKRFWESVQKAYTLKDLKGLDKLLKLTLLRTQALDQLTVEEISEARHWLEKDLGVLKSEERQLKKSLAWGFSEKKDFSSLTKKIRRDFEKTLNTLLIEIQEIQELHSFLERMAYEDQRERRKPRRQPLRRQRRGSRRRRLDEMHF